METTRRRKKRGSISRAKNWHPRKITPHTLNNNEYQWCCKSVFVLAFRKPIIWPPNPKKQHRWRLHGGEKTGGSISRAKRGHQRKITPEISNYHYPRWCCKLVFVLASRKPIIWTPNPKKQHRWRLHGREKMGRSISRAKNGHPRKITPQTTNYHYPRWCCKLVFVLASR